PSLARLLPYTTLFRSLPRPQREGPDGVARQVARGGRRVSGGQEHVDAASGQVAGARRIGNPAQRTDRDCVQLRRSGGAGEGDQRSEEHTSELQSRENL